MTPYAWEGADEPRFEVAFVELRDDRLTARGTQLGVGYRLTYVLETGPMFVSERLLAECETESGTKKLDLRRGTAPMADDVLDIDLAFSPLFNTLPVLRDGLHFGGTARDYVMAFVEVPGLAASRSEQRYVPLERRVVRFRSGTFSADIRFDESGFVLDYPGVARRVV